MTGKVTRRRFLKTTGFATAAVAGSTLFDARSLFAHPLHTRLDVGGLTATSPAIVSYKKAIHAMQLLPSTNPLSWTYQAAIHGSLLTPTHPAWNTCQHGNYFFFSWHRMYLYWFERIIRKMSGDPNFALPFWNYESASERYLPPMFRTPGTPLYTVNRGAGWNAGTSFLSASTVSTAAAMPLIPFNSFSSSLEGTPHAAVHVSIGGWMGSVPTAAQDPIFYLHHCNIDRLWNAWLALGGGRTDPLTDNTWKTKKFLFFKEDGSQVWMTSCDVLRAQEQLDYVYQGEPPQVKLYCNRIIPFPIWLYEVLMQIPPIRIPPGPDPGPYEIDVRQLRERMLTMAKDPKIDVTLELEGVEADRQPNVYWEVYAGLPKGEKPVFESPYYVGNLAMFGAGIKNEHQHEGSGPAAFSFKLNNAMQRGLASANQGALSLQFVARGAGTKEGSQARNTANVTVGKATISSRRLQEK